MQKRHLVLVIPATVAFLAISSGFGCAPSRTAATYQPQTFLPPVPYVSPAEELEAPAPLPAAPVKLQQTPRLEVFRSKAAEERKLIDAVDAMFQQGERRFENGDVAGARRSFDAALIMMLTVPDSLAHAPLIERHRDRLVEAIHEYDLAAWESDDASSEQDDARFEPAEMTFPIDPRLKDRVIEQVRSAVTDLPLEVNDEVLRYIRYYSTPRGLATLANGIARSGLYRPMIARILDEEGVPRELIQLAQAESGFRVKAVSSASATGMWQFMKSRGREYGLTQSAYEDLRLDPERATRAAARHLRDLYNQFGDWYLAMAAYNCGPYAVEKAVERTGYADFWELHRLKVLPRETLNYVPSIVAAAIMNKYAKEYGLDRVEPLPELAYDKVEIVAPTHLRLIADLADCEESEVRDLNPALLRSYAPAGYTLRVPAGTAPEVAAALNAIPEQKRLSWRMHRVSEGESVATIASRYRARASEISEVNQLDDYGMEAGEFLVIPVSAPKVAPKQQAPAKRAVQSRKPVRRASAASAPQKKRAKQPVAAAKRPSTARSPRAD
jgi:membrane-bound lytic murein transglycosylase D